MHDDNRTKHANLGESLVKDPSEGLRQLGTRTGVIANIVLFAQSKGIALSDMAAAMEIKVEQLVDPESRLPDVCMARAWLAVARAFPDRAPGLEMAAAAPMAVFGPFAQAIRHAASQRAGLETFARYRRVLSGSLDVEVIDHGQETAMRFRHPVDAMDDGHGAESALALGARLGREVMGDADALIRVELSHAPHGDPQAYHDYFKRPVRFLQADNALIFDSQALGRPPAEQNPALYAYIQTHLDRSHEQLIEALARFEPDELSRVRRAVSELANGSQYSAQALARHLGMSLRSLQRLTKTHGSSVRELIDEAREAQAKQLLSDVKLSIEEIAFLLDYADDRAFRRAFGRWTGQSPAAFRRTGQGRASLNLA